MTEEQVNGLITIAIFYGLYLLRNKHPFFKGLWKMITWFGAILLATLTVNYAKDKVKEWWDK